MPPPRARFTIRSLMFAVAGVAGVLALARWPAWPLLMVFVLDLIAAAMLWQAFHGSRRLAALGFGVTAGSVNLACIALGVFFHQIFGLALAVLAWLLGLPLMLGPGAAWATTVGRRGTSRRRPPLVTWPLVLALAFLPLTMLVTQWPFRLAFLASESALERLADRVAAGQALRVPIRAGLFVVVGSAVDRSSGNIALITVAAPADRSGFIRYRNDPNTPEGLRYGPFTNLIYHLRLSDAWRYECED